jgi:Dynein heavy chain C-terminal domain
MQVSRRCPQRAGEQDAVTAFLLAEQRTGDGLMAAIDSILCPICDAIDASNTSMHARDMHANACTPPRTAAVHIATLMKGELPAEWENLWPGPPEPVAFIHAATSRVRALKRLLTSHTEENSLIGGPRAVGLQQELATVSICTFFCPGAFVSTLRQAAARAADVSVDSLTLVTSWRPEGLPPAAQQAVAAGGVQVSGISIEGATFDGATLAAAAAGAPPRAAVPPVTLVWVLPEVAQQASESTLEGVNVLPVPLYLRGDRRIPILQIPMPVRNQALKQDFVIAGTAAFVSS